MAEGLSWILDNGDRRREYFVMAEQKEEEGADGSENELPVVTCEVPERRMEFANGSVPGAKEGLEDAEEKEANGSEEKKSPTVTLEIPKESLELPMGSGAGNEEIPEETKEDGANKSNGGWGPGIQV